MKITPPRFRSRKIHDGQWGIAASAYFGGRTEVRVRAFALPVVYVDFLSMYPTDNTLMDLWGFTTAGSLRFVSASGDVQAFLDRVTLEDVMRPETWPLLAGFAEIVPDGDILPVRTRYDAHGDAFTIGVNPAWCSTRTGLWYSLPDLVASKLLTGRTPRIRGAIMLRSEGRLQGMQPVDLYGTVRVDPSAVPFFRSVVEERQRVKHRVDLLPEERERTQAFLKVMANSGSYGIFAQADPEGLAAGEFAAMRVHAAGYRALARVDRPELPGEFAFMPIASLITGGARLKLSALERMVSDLGGSFVACDTDSMMIVSTRTGGLVPCPGGAHTMPDGRPAVRALSWDEVDQIIARFDALHPYDRSAVHDSLLKVETQNFDKTTKKRLELFCVAISAKRYVLFTRDHSGKIRIREYKESWLGRFLNPRDALKDGEERKDWIKEAWEWMLGRILGIPRSEPEWLDRPALAREALTSPDVVKRLARATGGKSYATQLKPFGFVLSAVIDPQYCPAGVDLERFHLLAPFNPDPRQWKKIPWVNSYDGTAYRITTARRTSERTVRVKSYRDVLEEYIRHPEHKSLGPDGLPCTGDTVGLLQRRPVRIARVVAIGKEAHRLEDVESGMVHSLDEVQTTYGELGDAWADYVLPILKQLPAGAVAAAAGIEERQVANLRNRGTRPSAKTRRLLTAFAAEHARATLSEPPEDDLLACAAVYG
ncbi:MAG: hypothetical protein NVSMB53_12720 [Gemmatimonadaceae bacterium]